MLKAASIGKTLIYLENTYPAKERAHHLKHLR